MKTRTVIPRPYFEISMECSHRRFHETKHKIESIADELDPEQEIDLLNAFMSESCDYEGDLDKITIYRGDESVEFVKKLLQEFGIQDKVPNDMHIVFTI